MRVEILNPEVSLIAIKKNFPARAEPWATSRLPVRKLLAKPVLSDVEEAPATYSKSEIQISKFKTKAQQNRTQAPGNSPTSLPKNGSPAELGVRGKMRRGGTQA
jgi:hypothetical protein